MKRNHTNNRVGKSGQSPYQKHKKVPHRYSEAYFAWRRTVTKQEVKRAAN